MWYVAAQLAARVGELRGPRNHESKSPRPRSSQLRGRDVGPTCMLIRDYVTSALCGVAWHGVVTLAVWWERTSLADLGQILVTPSSLAGALAGVVAGALTVRSRRRHSGRELWVPESLAC
jgi:hypothetical protein